MNDDLIKDYLEQRENFPFVQTENGIALKVDEKNFELDFSQAETFQDLDFIVLNTIYQAGFAKCAENVAKAVNGVIGG